MSNLSDIKHNHNIVEYISKYLPLKKSGSNYVACCPFHGEKTPSFTVDEAKQFYHCFGCGAHGNVIDFAMEYSGLEFIEACKHLGAESDLMPSAKVKQNQDASRNISKISLPPDHKQDIDKCAEILAGCQNVDGQYRDSDGNIYAPVIDSTGTIINLFDGFDFVAGGLSYTGFTPIIKKPDSNNYILVTSSKDGYLIANKYNVNVLICYSTHNLKYVFRNKTSDEKMKPALTVTDDDFLAYECGYFDYIDGVLVKRERKE